MGCTPSKTGANVYPGNKKSQILSHFVSQGNGRPLTPAPNTNTANPTKVTVPAGVSPGQTIRVQSPNGESHDIIVPSGQYSGSSFTVEFAAGGNNNYGTSTPNTILPPSNNPAYTPIATPSHNNYNTSSNYDSNYASNSRADDGFASGFNNPNYTPQATATILPVTPEISAQSYPTVQAVPVTNTNTAYSQSAYGTSTYQPNNYNATPTLNNYDDDRYAGVPSIFRPP